MSYVVLRMDLIHRPEETSLVLDAVVVYQADSVNKANNKLVPLIVDLHRCDVVMSLLPVDHFPLFDIPYPNHLVKAP